MGVALVQRELQRVMDFPAVVKRARELHTDGLTPTQKQRAYDMAVGTVYGRICSSESRDSPPTQLTSTPGRKTAFLFGADAIISNMRLAHLLSLTLHTRSPGFNHSLELPTSKPFE